MEETSVNVYGPMVDPEWHRKDQERKYVYLRL